MDLPNRKTPRVEFAPREGKYINVSTPLPPEMHKALLTIAISEELAKHH